MAAKFTNSPREGQKESSNYQNSNTAQKIKFSIKDFFIKSDQIDLMVKLYKI